MNYSIPRLLAHAIASRDAYSRLCATTLPAGFPPDVEQVWKALGSYYTTDATAEKSDSGAIFDRLCSQYPRYEDNYRSLQETVESVPISESNFLRDLRDQVRAGVSTEIVQLLLGGKWDKARELFDTNDVVDEESNALKVYDNIQVADVIAANDPSNRVQLSPSILNDYIKGGLPSPCHVLVFARPDMGKSSFMLNLTKGFCKQDKKVLYYSNEDNPQSFLMRSFTVFCGTDQENVVKHPTRVAEVLKETNYKNFFLAMSEEGSIREIDSLCREYEPDILVIDQLRNLSGLAESRTLQLEGMARAARTLSRRHSLICLSVSQAGESAAGKSYLTQEDLDYSKTGVQGAVDLMVGLGASEADAANNYVCVAFPKNKFAHEHFGPKLRLNYETGVYSNG